MRTFRTAVVTMAVIGALSLTGCTASTPTAATPTPSRTGNVPIASPTPSPTPQEDLTAVLVSATGLTLLDDNGAPAAEVSFANEDPASFVDALSASTGTAPTETTTPGGFEGAEFTTEYEWEGLLMSTGFSPHCEPACRGTFVAITSAELSGIPIRTSSGISVGDTVAEAQVLGARATPEIPLAAEPEVPELFDSVSEPTRIVILNLDGGGAEIVSIFASGWFGTFGNP